MSKYRNEANSSVALQRWPGNWLGKKWCTVNHFSFANHKSYFLRGWWVRNRRKNFLHCKPATCVCYSLHELKSLIAKQSITHVVYCEIKSSRINWKFVKLIVFIMKVGLLLILKLLLVWYRQKTIFDYRWQKLFLLNKDVYVRVICYLLLLSSSFL